MIKSETVTDPSPIEIDINIDEFQWKRCGFSLRRQTREAIAEAISMEGFLDKHPGSQIEVSVLLTSDDRIRQLNKQFRGQDKATNVLSFSQYENEKFNPQAPVALGDIILSYQTIEREAREQDKSFEHHYMHMLIHGLLHLIGYDHIEPNEAEEMEKLEIRILNEWNIENPY